MLELADDDADERAVSWVQCLVKPMSTSAKPVRPVLSRLTVSLSFPLWKYARGHQDPRFGARRRGLNWNVADHVTQVSPLVQKVAIYVDAVGLAEILGDQGADGG